MPRRSAAEKAETHQKILRHAARAFRAHGVGVSIDEVMRDLGLTHGGFYRHFASKDELLVEAVALALHEISDRLEWVARQAEPGRELSAVINAYLSPEHLQHPETWCALAALAPDVGRQPAAIKQRLAGAMSDYMEKMAKYLPGASVEERRGNFLVLFSGMAGAVAMLRTLPDKQARAQLLEVIRAYYLKTFAGAAP